MAYGEALVRKVYRAQPFRSTGERVAVCPLQPQTGRLYITDYLGLAAALLAAKGRWRMSYPNTVNWYILPLENPGGS